MNLSMIQCGKHGSNSYTSLLNSLMANNIQPLRQLFGFFFVLLPYSGSKTCNIIFVSLKNKIERNVAEQCHLSKAMLMLY